MLELHDLRGLFQPKWFFMSMAGTGACEICKPFKALFVGISSGSSCLICIYAYIGYDHLFKSKF